MSDGQTQGKRKSKSSLLRRPAFSPLSLIRDDDSSSSESKPPKTLLKKRPSFAPLKTDTSKSGGARVESQQKEFIPESPSNPRPSVLKRGRPSSIFGSLKSFKYAEDDTPPGTSTSSKASSLNWREFGAVSDFQDIGKNRTVMHHGEAQTNTGFFWKKREYLVLTETHLIRFKNQARASEVFHSVAPNSRSSGFSGMGRHSANPSTSSRADTGSTNSEHSGELVSGIPLEQIVAVYMVDDTRGGPTIEVAYLDSEASSGTNLSLQFSERDDISLWLRSIRELANRARVIDLDPIPSVLSEFAARVVEREQDYDVTNYRIFKVAKRGTVRTGSRSSADDTSKTTATICFLAIGIRSVHLIPLPKNPLRISSPSLSDMNEGGSYGIMCLTGGSVNASDDRFSLTFRSPFQPSLTLQLASLAATEIIVRIRQTEHFIRPDWLHRPYAIHLPGPIDDDAYATEGPTDDLDPFDRTMIAYCIAYGVNPASIRYGIFEDGSEDEPRFELFEPVGGGRSYSALELLCVIRSLRYNESYRHICFAGNSLDVLNTAFDRHGTEHVLTHTRNGRMMKMPEEDLKEASLLVHEIRALAMSNRKLRRFDFSYCIDNAPRHPAPDHPEVDGGCGIIEALFPLCKQQATNVDWIALNGIELQETDLDYLVGIAVEKSAHFRAIEASKTGLTDRGMALLLDVFRAHENTLESLDVSSNPLRLVPSILSQQLSAFGYIRTLDLSNLAVSSSTEPLLSAETLGQWRLEELRLRGIPLNDASIKALCNYLENPQSRLMRDLALNNCSLTGSAAADLMDAMSANLHEPRWLHLDVSENRLKTRFERFVAAVTRDYAPTHLTMRCTDYDDDDSFEELLLALAKNKSIKHLNIAQTYLPSEAGDNVCSALQKMLADNTTLEQLDISGEESRLEVSKLGVGINDALGGLKQNSCLEILKIQNQKLGLQGASTLADVLKENKFLRQLHCEFNGIPLSGFTDLVNALANNETLLFMPALEEGRDEALRQTEEQIKLAKNKEAVMTSTSTSNSKLTSMRKTFASLSASVGTSANAPRLSGKLAAVPEWTQQDIQAALRLVAEGWEGQKVRLNAYLERNWCIYKGIPLDEEPDQSEQRPGTAGSLSKILQRVAIDTTPTLEKQVQLGDHMAEGENGEEPATQEAQIPTELLGALHFDDSPLLKENYLEVAGDSEDDGLTTPTPRDSESDYMSAREGSSSQ